MSTTTIRDTVDNLKAGAGEMYEDLKTAAHDRVLDPIAEKGRQMAGAARHGVENLADYGRRTVERGGAWASSNPYSAAGIAFGVGLLAGVFLMTRCRHHA
jgi:ElaB/YqjD/DUF883 family membrane-anchored ribosome-binding protein